MSFLDILNLVFLNDYGMFLVCHFTFFVSKKIVMSINIFMVKNFTSLTCVLCMLLKIVSELQSF